MATFMKGSRTMDCSLFRNAVERADNSRLRALEIDIEAGEKVVASSSSGLDLFGPCIVYAFTPWHVRLQGFPVVRALSVYLVTAHLVPSFYFSCRIGAGCNYRVVVLFPIYISHAHKCNTHVHAHAQKYLYPLTAPLHHHAPGVNAAPQSTFEVSLKSGQAVYCAGGLMAMESCGAGARIMVVSLKPPPGERPSVASAKL